MPLPPAWSIYERQRFVPGVERSEASGLWPYRNRKFYHPLPISAERRNWPASRTWVSIIGGRGGCPPVSPNTPEGVWLRGYLKARNIPYYAFTARDPGKATAAHIHIGPGSTRLHSTAAD